MIKKIGLIQSRGLGDIHIALPIAFFYRQKGYEVYWPIYDKWIDQMNHYAPWIKWIPIKMSKDFFFVEPLNILKKKI